MDAPLLPPTLDGLWAAVALAALVLLVLAVRSQARERGLSPRQRVVWTAVVLLLPVVGPMLWFATTTPLRTVGAGDPAGAEWHSRRALR